MDPGQINPNYINAIGNPQLENQILNQANPPQKTQEENRRHRRSKHDPEGRIFNCDCGKSFLSKPALNNHIKNKHPDTLEGQIKRGRGRPRKYPPKEVSDFENKKYPNFFDQANRKAEEGKNIENDMENIVQKVFDELFKGNFREKLFSCPKSAEDDPILKNLLKKKELNEDKEKEKGQKNCNEVFYEYLKTFKDKVNDKYFILMTKFVILFRECYDKNKNKEKAGEDRNIIAGSLIPDGLPDLCNDFYGEFLEHNNFFGISEQDERDEIIELIQHFCIWLFKNEYTKSKLSLASS